MKYFTLSLLLLLVATVNADTLYIGGWSKHIGHSDFEYNETHNVLAYQHKGYVAGYFKNSYNDNTIFAAKKFEVTELGDLKIDLNIGLAYGYKECFSIVDKTIQSEGSAKICPVIAPEFSHNDLPYRIQPVIIIVGNAATLSFKASF